VNVIQEIGTLLVLEHQGFNIVVDTACHDETRPWLRWELFGDDSVNAWSELAANTNTHPESLLDLIDQAVFWYEVQIAEGQPRVGNDHDA